MKIEDLIKSTTSLSLNKRVLLNIVYTQTVISDGFHEILKSQGLSQEQFDVLVLLRELNGKCANMYMIQERMIAKTSNTTRLIDKLLFKGLVTREICNENRRKIEISITQKGLLILEESEPKIKAFETKYGDNLTLYEMENLNFLLEKYRISNDKYKI